MNQAILFIFFLFFLSFNANSGGEPSCWQSDSSPCSEVITAVDKPGSEKNYSVKTLSSQSTLDVCGRYLPIGEAPRSNSGYAYFGRERSDMSGCSKGFEASDAGITLYRMDKLTTSEKYVCNQYYNEDELVENGVIISGSESSLGYCTVSRKKIRKISDSAWSCSDNSYPGYYIYKVDEDSDCSGYRYQYKEIKSSDTTIYTCRHIVGENGWVLTGSSSSNSSCNGRSRYTYEKSVGYGCSVPVGMVATKVVPDSEKGYDCPLGKVYKIEEPSDGLSYCVGIGGTSSEDTPPDGMVVSAITMSNDCDSRTTYSAEMVTVSTPKVGTIMCTKYGEVPSGFGISDIKDRSECGAVDGGVLTTLTEGSAFCEIPTNLTGDWIISDISSNSSLCESGYLYKVGLASRTGHTPVCWVNNNDTSIPDDFVITNDMNSGSGAGCDGKLNYAYKISLPSETQYVCSLHNLPSSYGVIEYGGSTSDCVNYSYKIELLDVNNTYGICVNSLIDNEIPNGFVVTQIFNLSDCGSYQTAYKIEAPSSNGTTHVCHVQPPQNFPSGVVATDIRTSRNCHVGGEERDGYDAHYPPEDAKSVMCNGSNLPEGFEYYTSSTPSNCNSLTGAKYIQIIGLEDAFLKPFVYPEVQVDPSAFSPSE